MLASLIALSSEFRFRVLFNGLRRFLDALALGSLHLSARMEQRSFHWADFHEI